MKSSSGRRIGAIACALASLLMLGGCAATKVREVWKDDAYQGHPKNVLVIAMAANMTVRRTIESGFAKRLKEQGAAAVESFRVLPEGAVPEGDAGRDAITAAIREKGIDTVLLAKVSARRSDVRDIPGMTITTGHGMYPYGGYSAAVVVSSAPTSPTTQGYSHESKFLDIETHLFDVRSEKLVWAVQTETRISGAPQEEIKPYLDMVAKEMVRAKLF